MDLYRLWLFRFNNLGFRRVQSKVVIDLGLYRDFPRHQNKKCCSAFCRFAVVRSVCFRLTSDRSLIERCRAFSLLSRRMCPIAVETMRSKRFWLLTMVLAQSRQFVRFAAGLSRPLAMREWYVLAHCSLWHFWCICAGLWRTYLRVFINQVVLQCHLVRIAY